MIKIVPMAFSQVITIYSYFTGMLRAVGQLNKNQVHKYELLVFNYIELELLVFTDIENEQLVFNDIEGAARI